ncbi:hypothetical protein [Bradyrhizobium lupini]|uniref:hypothetical protein n=1 Tax=Rhizobium lupini TaxID=136996 RepID=UPI000309D7FB
MKLAGKETQRRFRDALAKISGVSQVAVAGLVRQLSDQISNEWDAYIVWPDREYMAM